jgi:hypothetical protein
MTIAAAGRRSEVGERGVGAGIVRMRGLDMVMDATIMAITIVDGMVSTLTAMEVGTTGQTIAVTFTMTTWDSTTTAITMAMDHPLETNSTNLATTTTINPAHPISPSNTNTASTPTPNSTKNYTSSRWRHPKTKTLVETILRNALLKRQSGMGLGGIRRVSIRRIRL